MGVLEKVLLSTDTVFADSTLCTLTTSVVKHVKEEEKTSSSVQLPCVCRVQEVSSRQNVFSLEKRLEKQEKMCFHTLKKNMFLDYKAYL